MPFLMIRNDITKVAADAIVNPATGTFCRAAAPAVPSIRRQGSRS